VGLLAGRRSRRNQGTPDVTGGSYVQSDPTIRGLMMLDNSNIEGRLQTALTVSTLVLTFICELPAQVANQKATDDSCASPFAHHFHDALYGLMYWFSVGASLLSAKSFFAAIVLYISFSRHQFHPEDYTTVRAWYEAHTHFVNVVEYMLIACIIFALIGTSAAFFINWLDYENCEVGPQLITAFIVSLMIASSIPVEGFMVLYKNRHLFMSSVPNDFVACPYQQHPSKKSSSIAGDGVGGGIELLTPQQQWSQLFATVESLSTAAATEAVAMLQAAELTPEDLRGAASGSHLLADTLLQQAGITSPGRRCRILAALLRQPLEGAAGLNSRQQV